MLYDEGAGEAASFPHARTVLVLSRLLIEHYITRDKYLVSAWVVEPVRLGTLRVAQEHHRCAPVLQLGEDRLRLPDMADAAECPEEGHTRLASMPRLERLKGPCVVLVIE